MGAAQAWRVFRKAGLQRLGPVCAANHIAREMLQYQKVHKLTMDGIVGSQMWGRCSQANSKRKETFAAKRFFDASFRPAGIEVLKKAIV